MECRGLLLIEQAEAAFNQVFQPLGEACCWSAVNNVMIQADRQAEIFSDGDVSIHDARLLNNAPQGELKRLACCRDRPAYTWPKHADGCDAARSGEAFA